MSLTRSAIMLIVSFCLLALPSPAPAADIGERLSALEKRQEELAAENRKLREELKTPEKAAEAVPQTPAPVGKKAVEFVPYGFVDLTGWAHDARFNASELPLYVKDESESTTGVTAKRSRLGTKILFPQLETVKLSATLEIDFFTNMADTGFAEGYAMIRMRHAFFDLSRTWGASMLGCKIGQTWLTAVPNFFPAVVNPAQGWAVGNLWQRMPLAEVYFTQKFADTFAFTAQLAAVRAITGASANRNGFLEVNIDAGDASHIPQIQAQLSLKGKVSGLDLLLAVGGAWGRENYKGGVLQNRKTVTYTGGIVDVGLIHPALKIAHEYFELAGKFYWGQNLDGFGAFGGGLLTEQLDAATVRVIGSRRTMGYWGQVTGKPLKGLSLNIGYGAEDPDQKQEGAAPGYERNSSLWISSFYTFFDHVTLGFQWAQVWTDTAGGRLTGNSIMGNVRLSF